MSYEPGSIKQNPDTLDTAVRVQAGHMDWLVASMTRGAHWADDQEVADWPDVPDQAAAGDEKPTRAKSSRAKR